MKTIRDSLSRRVRDQKQQRLDGEWELRRAAGFERRRSKSRRCAEEEEQSRAEAWPMCRTLSEVAKPAEGYEEQEETCARETDANLM